jgi:hypothetical protein
MRKSGRDRRKYPRYDTEVKIYFHVHYSLKTKVKFQLIKKDGKECLSKKYFGLTKDISVEGLRFSSPKRLRKRNRLYLEIYLPGHKEPVWMMGEVRWSRKLCVHPKRALEYDTGVKLTSVMGEPVFKSIHYDKKFKVFWSSVLSYAFGSFKKLTQKKTDK